MIVVTYSVSYFVYICSISLFQDHEWGDINTLCSALLPLFINMFPAKLGEKNNFPMIQNVFDELTKQLRKNIEAQDYYKSIVTEIRIGYNANANVIQLMHPSQVLDLRTEDLIFPDREWDIDKEFEEAIAIYFTFSMKADKKELQLFQELDIRKYFKEIKDFGIRAYAIDCGKDYNKAATYVNIILEKVYNVSEGSTITIETSDFNNIESAKICKESLTVPYKITGIATRVKEQKEDALSNETPLPEISDKTYNRLLFGAISIIILILIVFIVNMTQKETPTTDDIRAATQDTTLYVDSASTAPFGVVSSNSETSISTQETASEPEQNQVIGKWIETSYGNNGATWLLEKEASTGRLLLTSRLGDIIQSYNCTKRRIKGNNSYIFHDPNVSGNNGLFSMRKGTTIYYISGFDNNSDAILVPTQDGFAKIYSNDVDNRYYELFSNLSSVN